jgi:KRAB domain-containing zinc finger protein
MFQKLDTTQTDGNLSNVLEDIMNDPDIKPQLEPFEGKLQPLPIHPLSRFKPFTCDICHKGVGTRGGMMYHIKAHLNGRPFKCDICHKSYATKNDFDTHFQRHQGKSYSCDFCGRNYKVRQYLVDHIRDFHLPKTFLCKMCRTPKYFSCTTSLKKHVSRAHTRGKRVHKFHCKICGLGFSSYGICKKHCDQREQLRFQCIYCNEKFPCYKLYHQHRLEEKRKRSFCEICKIRVKNIKTHLLQKHTTTACKFCGKPFSKLSLYNIHLKMCITQEKIETLNIKCKVCNLYFLSEHKLNSHVNSAHGTHECDSCLRPFRSKAHLYRHKRECKTRTYRCLVCPKRPGFTSRDRFEAHVHMNHMLGRIPNRKTTPNWCACDKCGKQMKGLATSDKFMHHIKGCYGLIQRFKS